MAETASGPRYAPEDPTLPKPWRGLVDGTSGYLYFWNPETNVTQYERPKPARGGASVPSPGRAKPSSNPLSSSVQVHHHRSSRVEEDVRYNGDVNGGRPKLAAIPGGRDYQVGQVLLLIPWVLVQMYSWGGGIELLPALL